MRMIVSYSYTGGLEKNADQGCLFVSLKLQALTHQDPSSFAIVFSTSRNLATTATLTPWPTLLAPS